LFLHIQIDGPELTYGIKNHTQIRSEVQLLKHNLLSSRRLDCPHGKEIISKNFTPQKIISGASMYFTRFYFLGQVGVELKDTGYYRVDCCRKEYNEWYILISGSFEDKFDELIPLGFYTFGLLKKGYLSLPITFTGSWVEDYSGYGEENE